MESATEVGAGVYSSFGGDPDLGELVEMFVEEMPDRIDTLQQAFTTGDFELLQRSAHQLKGAGGSYGFDQVTPYALALESSLKEGEPADAIEKHLEELVGICQKLRAGEPA